SRGVVPRILYWDLMGEGGSPRTVECDRALFTNDGAMREDRYCGLKRYIAAAKVQDLPTGDQCRLGVVPCEPPNVGVNDYCRNDVAGWTALGRSLRYASCCRYPTCGELGGALCEHSGNGACGGIGARTIDCDSCCGGSLPTCGGAGGNTCERTL